MLNIARELDKYYTKEHIAKQCADSIRQHRYDLIIEPSAGSGNFIKYLTGTVVALDIHPEHNSIIRQDWMQYRIPHTYQRVLIIGNPPFGINHTMSDAFIRHSLSFANVQTIAFILPNTYKKHTRQRILPQSWRIKDIIDIADNAFTFNNNTRHIPCSFFIFDKSAGKDLRLDPNKHKETQHFTFGTKSFFDLFVFGAAPRKITYNPQPNNRGYFLKAKKEYTREFIARNIRDINWRGNSCANGGVYWLTKAEFIEQYNRLCPYKRV